MTKKKISIYKNFETKKFQHITVNQLVKTYIFDYKVKGLNPHSHIVELERAMEPKIMVFGVLIGSWASICNLWLKKSSFISSTLVYLFQTKSLFIPKVTYKFKLKKSTFNMFFQI